VTRGCHGYIPEEYIHALYPYPLRIRAGDAYSKCIMRKRGEDISILSDKNCKIISDPYFRYERQDTGIYKIIKLLGPTEFRYKAVHLSFPNPTIGRFMCKHFAATSGNPARPGRNRSGKRLGPLLIPAKCDTSFRTVYLTTVYKNGGGCLDRARGGAHIRCEYHVVLDVHLALNKCLNGVFLWP